MAYKRPRADASAAPTADEAVALLQRLSDDNVRAVLSQLLKESADARAAIKREVDRLQTRPLDLNYFATATSDALGLLNGLRCSKQYERSHEVTQQLREVIGECKQLSDVHALRALTHIIGVILREAQGEVRKAVLGCGGTMSDIAAALGAVINGIGEADCAAIVGDIAALRRVASELEDYGITELDEVLEEFDAADE
jgi:hypothetical protein